MLTYIVILILGFLHLISGHEEPKIRKRFPDDFRFGASTAAYQVEGAWNTDGKGWSMWDHLVHTNPAHIADNNTGDVTANSYHLYKRDVQMLKELGVDSYRFSISWPRILPYGRPDYINPLGIEYYNNLINELLANDIEPFVTIYHWDLPQNLNEQGGILNKNFPDWLTNYARVLFQNFGDRVKFWLTINEPYIHCLQGYSSGAHAPRIKSSGVGFYRCGRQLLLANAKTYRMYDREFRPSQGGQIGIVLNMDWGMPSTDSEEDKAAVEAYFAFLFGQYMDPIFSAEGNYPQLLIDRVANSSAAQGLTKSRLHPFSYEEIHLIRGTSDFLALNTYSAEIVYRNSSVIDMYEIPSYQDDAFFATYKDPSWPKSACFWLMEYAPGLYHLLLYIREKYGNPAVYITENGFSTPFGLVDDGRVQYLRNYLSSIQDAMEEGVDVRGYFAWSLMDNFEWSMGFTQKFGLYEIDMNDPERTRTPRKSALVYKDIISSRVIDYEYNPDPFDIGSGYSFKASVVTIVATAILNLIR